MYYQIIKFKNGISIHVSNKTLKITYTFLDVPNQTKENTYSCSLDTNKQLLYFKLNEGQIQL